MTNRSDNENIINRVYHSLKESVITFEFSPGERLNIELIAEQLRVSTTPVRECLNRLVAEDLILMIPRLGFFMKSLLESEIRDLYEFNRVLLDWSIVNIAGNNARRIKIDFPEISSFIDKLMRPENPSNHNLVSYSGKLFAHLAMESENGEINVRVRNINDRLHYIRICECELEDDPKEQLLPLFKLYLNSRYDELRRALSAYHETRLGLLPNIIRGRNCASRLAYKGFEI